MELFLTLLSGIGWTLVYIDSIRKGFKDKTYAIPLYALGLNFAWEVIYSFRDIRTAGVQGIVNIIWMLCDAVIVFTYFKYGSREFPDNAKRAFIPFSLLSFAACAVFQLAFLLEFPEGIEAATYSAFAQNAAMSIMFVVMLYRRGSARGQSMLIAVAKWIGTLAPTLLLGVVKQFNIYVILTGSICSVFDILYIVLLRRMIAGETKPDRA